MAWGRGFSRDGPSQPSAAQAAVPDKWGLAFVDKPTVAGIPDLSHQAGTWPAPMHAHSAPVAPGQVIVRFPNLATKGGVVHRFVQFPRVGLLPNTVFVTPFHVGPGFCNLLTVWATLAANVLVRDVACFKATGTLMSQESMVTYTSAH